jgi:glycosyltransferase involved in cell wall biosynthesis
VTIDVLHLTPSVGPLSGGLGTVTIALAREQRDLNCNPRIWCTDPSVAGPAEELNGAIEPMRPIGPRQFAFSLDAERRARHERFDVVHQHGIWTAQSMVTSVMRRRNIPCIVAPHGSLEPYAIRMSEWKKRIALAGFEQRNLEKAACLHATAESELATFRDFGLRGPVAILPNGVDEAWLDGRGDADAFRRRHGIAADQRILLFVSRIVPKKGLPLLIDALASIRQQLAGWCVVIAGQDERGHRAEIEALVARQRLESMVRFVGPVFGGEKRDMFAAADVFILPTHSDNFAIVIAEALGAGVPVITTHGAPWRELETRRCGWWVGIDPNAIADAIADAAMRSRDELRAMGERGRELVRGQYTWPAVAERSIAVYRWLARKAEKPDFVILN